MSTSAEVKQKDKWMVFKGTPPPEPRPRRYHHHNYIHKVTFSICITIAVRQLKSKVVMY